jgi:hypothetical protein
MEKTLPNKGILEKLTKERKNLAFYTAANKLKPQTSHNPKTPNSIQQL